MNDVSRDVFSSKDYKRSRNAYCLECAFEYFVALMVSDAFLALLMRTLGLSDDLIVIVSSLVSLAFLFQLFAIFVVQKITNTKLFVIIFHFLSQLVFMSLYLLPFLTIGNAAVRNALTVAGILLAYFGNYFVTSMIYRWGNSFVSPERRGRYGASKEMISLISGIVVTLGVGYVMDIFTKEDPVTKVQTLENGGLIFAAIAIFVFSICDLICLLLIKNDLKPKNEVKASVPMKEVLLNTVGNKNFVNVIILTILYNVGIYTTAGVLGTYKLDLFTMVNPGNPMLLIQIVNIIGVLARFAVSKPFGRYSDKRSYTKGIELSLIFLIVSYLLVAFTTNISWFLIIFFVIISGVAAAGTSANFLNITYSYVDERYFVQASAIKNSIGGVCGFCAAFFSSQLVKYIQGNGNSLFGIPVNAAQVLGLISTLIFVAAFIFTKLVVEKQKIMKQ